MKFERLVLFKHKFTPPKNLVLARLVTKDGFYIHVWVNLFDRRRLLQGFGPEERFVDMQEGDDAEFT